MNKVETRLILYKAVKSLIDYIEPNKGLNEEQIKESVDWIIEDFKMFKLEEILAVITDMKKTGKYFERLKYPEIKSRIEEYINSEARAKIIEEHNLSMKPESQDSKYIEVDYQAYIEKVAEKRKAKTHDGSITQLQALERFEQNICLVHEISYDELKSDSQKVEIMDVKKIIQYFQRYQLKWTYEKIGDYWNRDHSTIIKNIQSAIDLKLVTHEEND